jgi:hypothetical protein
MEIIRKYSKGKKGSTSLFQLISRINLIGTLKPNGKGRI